MRFVTFASDFGVPFPGLIRGEDIVDLDNWLNHRTERLQAQQKQFLDFATQARSGDFEAVQRLMDWTQQEAAKRTQEAADRVNAMHIEGWGLLGNGPLDMVSIIKLSTEQLITNLGFLARIVDEMGERTDKDLREANLLVPLTEALLYSPIPRPPKHVLCLGRNYAEHAAESTRAFGETTTPVDKPDFPTVFTKATTSITGPYSDIPYDPNVTTELDWEGELAVVIGKAGKNIRREDAMQHVFGYTVLNDISARDIQKRHGGQFFKGKSLDGSCPIGPWIVTADEIPDPHNLEITVRVNGVVKQHDNTRSMLFTIPEIIEHLSLGMTLEPGDIIATGTPAGVGFARTPPEFLSPGDIVEVEIEKIGTITNRIAEA